MAERGSLRNKVFRLGGRATSVSCRASLPDQGGIVTRAQSPEELSSDLIEGLVLERNHWLWWIVSRKLHPLANFQQLEG